MTPFPGHVIKSKTLGTPYIVTKEQSEWIAEHYPVTPDHELAKAMGVSVMSVRRIAKKMGLAKNKIQIFRRAMEKVVWSEKFRQRIELPPKTNFYIARRKYTVSEITRRYRAVHNFGYVLDEDYKSNSRYVIYYDADTRRNKQFEDNCIKAGFTVKEWEE